MGIEADLKWCRRFLGHGRKAVPPLRWVSAPAGCPKDEAWKWVEIGRFVWAGFKEPVCGEDVYSDSEVLQWLIASDLPEGYSFELACAWDDVYLRAMAQHAADPKPAWAVYWCSQGGTRDA